MGSAEFFFDTLMFPTLWNLNGANFKFEKYRKHR